MAERDPTWIFTKDQLEKSPSRKDGISFHAERSMRQNSASLIQELGQKLGVTQLTINTAIVFVHRYFIVQTFHKSPTHSVCAACLFLAAKVEEQPRKLALVVEALHSTVMKNKDGTVTRLERNSNTYFKMVQDIVNCENVLLQTLGFDVEIKHPHTSVIKHCQMFKATRRCRPRLSDDDDGNPVQASKDLAQTAYFLATNSLHLTTYCLQYTPTIVACMCIDLACKWSEMEIPPSAEGKSWWTYCDSSITQELLLEITDEFLQIMESCPKKNDLKTKLLGFQRGKEGRSSSGAQQAGGSGASGAPALSRGMSESQSAPNLQAEELRRGQPPQEQSRGPHVESRHHSKQARAEHQQQVRPDHRSSQPAQRRHDDRRAPHPDSRSRDFKPPDPSRDRRSHGDPQHRDSRSHVGRPQDPSRRSAESQHHKPRPDDRQWSGQQPAVSSFKAPHEMPKRPPPPKYEDDILKALRSEGDESAASAPRESSTVSAPVRSLPEAPVKSGAAPITSRNAPDASSRSSSGAPARPIPSSQVSKQPTDPNSKSKIEWKPMGAPAEVKAAPPKWTDVNFSANAVEVEDGEIESDDDILGGISSVIEGKASKARKKSDKAAAPLQKTPVKMEPVKLEPTVELVPTEPSIASEPIKTEESVSGAGKKRPLEDSEGSSAAPPLKKKISLANYKKTRKSTGDDLPTPEPMPEHELEPVPQILTTDTGVKLKLRLSVGSRSNSMKEDTSGPSKTDEDPARESLRLKLPVDSSRSSGEHREHKHKHKEHKHKEKKKKEKHKHKEHKKDKHRPKFIVGDGPVNGIEGEEGKTTLDTESVLKNLQKSIEMIKGSNPPPPPPGGSTVS